MKKHFKLILAALSALLLFLTNVPVVSAAEGDTSQSGDNEQLYKTTITIHVVDWAEKFNGGTQTVTVVSSSPLYICKHRTDEPATYLRFFCGDIVDYEQHGVAINFSSLSNCSASYLFTYADGTTEISNRCVGLSAIEYQGKIRMTVTATCPIFTDEESLENHLRTGVTDGWENYMPDKEWNYSGTISATDSVVTTVEDKTYSFCSDGRLAILNEEEYVYQLYTGTESAIYENSGKSLTKFSVDGVLWYNLFPATRYNSYKSTIPIFKTREDLLHYIETGDTTGSINKDDFKTPVSKSLPYLRNVAWHINPNCYGSSPKVIGDEFTWDTSGSYPAAKIEVKADVTIHFGKTNDFSVITGTGYVQFDMKKTVDVISYDDSTGLSSPSYDSGYLLIPENRLRQAVSFYLDNNTDLSFSSVQSVSVTSFYLRMVFYDETEKVLNVGGWTRINVQDYVEGGDFISTGDFDSGTGDYVQDTTSDDSYSYGTNIDGSYDFDNSNGIPKNLEEALSQFVDIIGALMKSMGKVPALIKTVFGFLPNVFFALIGASFTVVVILRILGR